MIKLELQRYLNSLRSSLWLIGLLLPITTFALPTDKDQPFNIEADNATLNHKAGIGIYRGHVQLTQGTTILKSAKLVTYLDKQQHLEKAIATGELASLQTVNDSTKPAMILMAESINYFPQRGWAEAIGKANATQGENNYTGPQLNYDINKGTIASTFLKQGRTKVTINPSQKL